MHPHQVISLEDLPGETSFALPDHYDHVHVGYHPLSGPFDQQFNSLLKPGQWQRLTNRLGQIENPEVPTEPSQYALARWQGQARSPANRPPRAARTARTAAPKAATDRSEQT